MKSQLILYLFCLLLSFGPAWSETLQGGIDHSEYMPAMPSEMQQGNAYYAAPPQNFTVIWYPIPEWMAGTFQSDFITNQVTQVFSRLAPPHRTSGALKHIETFGALRVRDGQVWHADILPATSVWSGAQQEIQTTVRKQCMQTDNGKVVLHIHNQAVYLAPNQQTVVYSNQVDGFKNITPVQTGELGIYDDIQEYDAAGKPLDRYIATSQMRKIADFVPKEFDRGIDLRASLAQYLQSIGRTDLIPVAQNQPNQ